MNHTRSWLYDNGMRSGLGWLPIETNDLMPPSNKGGPLPKEEIQTLKEWIDQGAYWPEGVTLQAKKKEEVDLFFGKIRSLLNKLTLEKFDQLAEKLVNLFKSPP